ncbi:hypothetical protein [Sphingomonas sp. DC1400]|uniref:hypothetical protein n=2 Tax=unclassified Sphingomonas TaxID=196159 RepID=UPI003CEB953A
MGANPLRGEATVFAAGRMFRLVFDVNALCLAEAAMNSTTDAIILALERDTVDLQNVRAMIWAGMQAEHPSSLARAESLIEDLGYAGAKDAVLAGLRGAFGLAAEGGDSSHPRKASLALAGSICWSNIARLAARLRRSGHRRPA